MFLKPEPHTNRLLRINTVFKQRKDRPREEMVVLLLLPPPSAFTTKVEEITPTEAYTLRPFTAAILCLLIVTKYFRIRFPRKQHNDKR
jgi:hypothetical protein